MFRRRLRRPRNICWDSRLGGVVEMGNRRRDIDKKCIQMRKLYEEGRYNEALEVVDEFEGELPESVRDLRVIAELQEKTKRIEDMKATYVQLCEITHTHHALKSFIRALIRVGDYADAGIYLGKYEEMDGATSDDFELRYALMKAFGASLDERIDLLEKFKKQEYMEKWGKELAECYRDAGRDEDYKRELADLNLWFGGARFIAEEKIETNRSDAEVGGEIAENLAAKLEEKNEIEEQISEAVAQEVSRIADAEANSEPEHKQPKRKHITETLEIPKEGFEAEDEELSIPDAPVVESVGVPKTLSGKPLDEEFRESFEARYLNNKGQAETVGTPVVSDKKNSASAEVEKLFAVEEDYEEGPEDISARGIRYWTTKDTIAKLRRGDFVPPHFVLAGGEEKTVLTMSKKLSKELARLGYTSAKKVVRISSERLNKVKITEQIDKLLGACLLVTEAAELTKDTVENLLDVLHEFGEEFVVMLAGPFDEMDCFLEIYPELSEQLGYKVRMLL